MTDAQPADQLVAALEAIAGRDWCDCHSVTASRSRHLDYCPELIAARALPIAREMAEREREKDALIGALVGILVEIRRHANFLGMDGGGVVPNASPAHSAQPADQIVAALRKAEGWLLADPEPTPILRADLAAIRVALSIAREMAERERELVAALEDVLAHTSNRGCLCSTNDRLIRAALAAPGEPNTKEAE